MKSSRITIFLLAAALIFGPATVWAAITGTISGVVKDSTGGVIPGVSVTASNTQTGLRQTVETNDSGFYRFLNLPIGSYEVNVRRAGFRDFRQTSLVIDANSALTVDPLLQVGDTTEVVSVASAAVHVETQNTQLGEVIEGTRMSETPLNGRSFTDLLALQPGVSPYQRTAQGGASTVSGNLNPGNQSVNGGRESSNAFMVNGSNVNEGEYNGASVIPNLDSIAEFRIITSNFDAEYGNYSGGQINVATKTGTNQYHGNVFEFLRNTDLNTRNFYSPTKGKFIQNQFGGTFGGPIKKDKLFFFADYQGTRLIQGVTENLQVASPAARAGDFSTVAASLRNRVNGAYWADQLSKRLGYTVAANEPYYTAGCASTAVCVFPGAIVPQKTWATPAAPLLQYVPLPNAANNFFSTSANNLTLGDDKGSARVDGESRFGRLSAYYLMDNFSLNNPYASATRLPGFNVNTPGRSQLVVLRDTKTFGPSALNEASFSYMRYTQISNYPSGGVGPKLSSLGFVTGASTLGLVEVTPELEGVPSVTFNSGYSIGLSQANQRFNNLYQLSDNFSKIIGTHSLKFGASFHDDQINALNIPAPAQFTFSGAETGIDFADFLIGAPSAFVQSSQQLLDSRSKYMGLYAQDSWRAKSNLTFNYGLRWEFSQPWKDTQGKIKTVIPGLQSVLFPGAPLGLVYPGDPGVADSLAPTKYDEFSPRVGLAYSPGATGGWIGKLLGGPGKTSIRAGFGVYFTAIEDLTLFNLIGGVPYGLFYSAPAPTLFDQPYIDRATGFSRGQRFPYVLPTPDPSHPNTSINWAQLKPVTPTAYFHTNRMPYSEHYEFSLQRQFGTGTLLTLGYVGNQAHKLISSTEGNPGNAPLCLSLTQPSAVAPGSPTCGPFGESAIYTTASGQVINGTRNILGPDYTSVTYVVTMGNSAYNSAQVTLRHTSKRLSFLLGYTFSKSLDNASALGQIINPYNFRLSRALSSFDVTHNFVISYSLQLVDRPFGSNNRLLRGSLGGWVLSGISTFATGLPVTLNENDDRSLLEGSGQGAPDVPNRAPGQILANTDPRSRQVYFNTAIFTAEPLGQIGNSSRRFFHGPGINNFNMALLKNFSFTESKLLQLRLEAFNTFNHAQFMNPNGTFNSTSFGMVTAARDPRIVQVAAKLTF